MWMLDPVKLFVSVLLLSFSEPLTHEFLAVATAGADSREQKEGSKLFFAFRFVLLGALLS